MRLRSTTATRQGVRSPRGTSRHRYSPIGTGLRCQVQGSSSGTRTNNVMRSAFGSPDYETNSPVFAFQNFWQTSSGAEVDSSSAVTIQSMAIWDGVRWHRSSKTPWTLAAGLGGLLGGFDGVKLPKNALIWYVIHFSWLTPSVNVPQSTPGFSWGVGNVIGTSDSALGFSGGTAFTDAEALVPAAGVGSQPSFTSNGTGQFYAPSWCFAKGGDGRPAVGIFGDSIGYGVAADNPSRAWTARREFGLVNVGLDDVSRAKRLAYLNCCIPGQAPLNNGVAGGGWLNRARWVKKQDLLKLAADQLNNGLCPFDIIISEHGENSCSAAKSLVTEMPQWYARLNAEFPGIPIYQHELLPKPRSSDKFRTFANQNFTNEIDGTPNAANIAASDSYNSGVTIGMGDRWLFSAALQPGGALRTAGWVQGSIPTWKKVAYDLGNNRDKLVVPAFTTTITGTYNSGNQQVPMAAVPPLGAILAVDTLGGYAATNGPVGSTSVEISAQGLPTGSLVNGLAAWEMTADSGALHPSGRYHNFVLSEAYVDWKVEMGFGL